MKSVNRPSIHPYIHVMRCEVWYHLYHLASACNFTEINTPPWVFFTFLKLYKCYQIAQRITHTHMHIQTYMQQKHIYAHKRAHISPAQFESMWQSIQSRNPMDRLRPVDLK